MNEIRLEHPGDVVTKSMRIAIWAGVLALVALLNCCVNRASYASGKGRAATNTHSSNGKTKPAGTTNLDEKGDHRDSVDPKKGADSNAAPAAPSMEEQVHQLDEKLKALAGAIEEQQKKSDEKVNKLEQIIEQQQKLLEGLQTRLSGAASSSVSHLVPSNGTTAGQPNSAAGAEVVAKAAADASTGVGAIASSDHGPAGSGGARSASVATASSGKPQPVEPSDSPLSLRIGSVYITPAGYADFLLYYRSTDVGSGLSTNFGGIPFSNTPQGQLSELRTTAQASRLGARLDTMFHDTHVMGYFETDFLGAVPGNAAVTSNSDSLRIRLAFVDVRHGKFELLAGQSWSLITPDKNGMSPMPADVYYGHLDPGNQLGLTWKRDPQIRFVYHAKDWLTFGVSAEQPEQYIGGSGGAGAITLPSALATVYGTELNNGNTTQSVPNVAPDFVVKVAFDPKVNGRDLHVEFNGLERNFKVYNPFSRQSFSATGGGGSLNLSLYVLKQLRLISENFYSEGGGRYVFGEEPDLVIRGDGSISLVRTLSTFQGFEMPINDNTTFWAYYGGVYGAKNVQLDPVTRELIGFGYPGAPASQNRDIQEPTFGFSRTFWRDPRYGALQMNFQYSYVIRSPWMPPTTGPRTASTNMVFVDFRYILPGAPPKMPYSY